MTTQEAVAHRIRALCRQRGITPNGLTVFGTFTCGGGSAMGYKLAGFDYLGGVEIDKEVGEIYKRNLHPRYFFNEDIRAFNARTDLPVQLYNLDILDGSPPCTMFSFNREQKREDNFGKPKVFAEGQQKQTLDDLVFIWTDTVKKLQPKVALMENVEGLTKGGAKKYLANILKKLSAAGYDSQVFILNAERMGVPQSRRRCFVIARRRDLDLPKINFDFTEELIPFREIRLPDNGNYKLTDWKNSLWQARKADDTDLSEISQRVYGKMSGFSTRIIHENEPCRTLVTVRHVVYVEPRFMSDKELLSASTFPQDYDYNGGNIVFLTGMCVPPVMTAQISRQIAKQMFGK